MKRLIYKITFAAILLTLNILPLQAQIAAPPKNVKVKIYLLDDFESENLRGNMRMIAVEREVNAENVLRSALEAQLSGATEDESLQLLFSPVSDIELISVKIANKTVYASFKRNSADVFGAIDALRFKKAVTKTALQFRSIRRVEICLNDDAKNKNGGQRIVKTCR